MGGPIGEIIAEVASLEWEVNPRERKEKERENGGSHGRKYGPPPPSPTAFRRGAKTLGKKPAWRSAPSYGLALPAEPPLPQKPAYEAISVLQWPRDQAFLSRFMKFRSSLTLAGLMALLPFSGQAATISGLVNTGLDALGEVQADDAEELHWSITPEGGTTHAPVVATSAGGFPIGPWLGDSADSAWITYSADTNAPPINYEFAIPFSLTGLDVDSMEIFGRWSSDNAGTDILLNGVSSGQTNDLQFADWSLFSFTSADGDVFNQDDNVLTFTVNNAPPDNNPMGIRVEFSQATATVIPEPSSAGLALLGLLTFLRRRRS